ncbi:class I adenylate-forming enzyme family protein [Cupriavidus gilardii]|uniref:class I adenylate-forming enzyme family protein n=1 Tax=Cupriavidus gilardii TaxID=82541 RepID=UPI0007E3A402|nr:AMP-binding protein [Cupriavidus gilardii]
MYLTQGLHRAIQRHPGKTAICHVEDGQPRTTGFAALGTRVALAAAALKRHGIGSGDRVALLAQNGDGLIAMLLACWWRGAVACPLNTRWSAQELRHAIGDCGARLLLPDRQLTAIGEELRDLATVVPIETFLADAEAAAGELEPLDDTRTGGDALAAILYTGGTTGRAKGVMLSHANFWAASIARAAELNNAPDSVSLLVAPLFHVAGLGRLIGQLIAGGSCVTLPQFRADIVLSATETHRISDIIVVPTMLQSLLDHPGFDAARLQSLNRIAFGAAPMPPDLLARALEAWPNAEFFQAYGMTETAAAVCINPPANHRPGAGAERHRHSVGRAGLGAEIRVIDPQGNEVPRGTVGEIVVRGPMVMRGYWNQPDATAQALRDGWLHTGDGGWMDEDGYLFIADRLKDMIISGGENIYSAEVETALRGHPRVAQAAVIGVPDARWGERVHAVVVVEDRASLAQPDDAALSDELTQWCRERLAGYKCPRSFAYVDGLPLSAAGKVLKNELRRRYREEAGGRGG